MTTYNTDGIHALRALEGGNPVSDVDAGFAALRDDIDGKLTPYDSGLLADRPVSSGGSPGKAGRLYRATDDTSGGPSGTLYVDHGTGWLPLQGVHSDLTVTGTATLDSALAIVPGSEATADVALTTTSKPDRPVDTGAGVVSITLPAAPLDGQRFNIYDSGGNADVDNITIVRNGKGINGVAANLTINTAYGGYSLVYIDVIDTWFATAIGGPTAWINATMQNGWIGAAAYTKDPLGVVHLRGQSNYGGSSFQAFTLPSGYRPQVQYKKLPAIDVSLNTLVVVQVNTDGTVTAIKSGGGAANTVDWSAVSFPTW